MSQQRYNSKAIHQVRNRSQYTLNQSEIDEQISNQPTRTSSYSTNIGTQTNDSIQNILTYVNKTNDTVDRLSDPQPMLSMAPQLIMNYTQQTTNRKQEESPPTLTSLQNNEPKVVVDENGIEYDQHGNLLSSEYDLGIDGAFNDFSVLIALFSQELYGYWDELSKRALEKKGFLVDVILTENQLIKALKDDMTRYDTIWIIGHHQQIDQYDMKEFSNLLIEYHKTGRGLFILGDNDPHYFQCNLVLPQLVGCFLTGNKYGDKTLKYGVSDRYGEFDSEHLIFAGINNLHEGITICYPDNESNKLKTLATGTDGRPCILCCERNQSNFENGGRIVVDSGWTKLARMYWAHAGQARYVVNACVWLVDLEGRFGMNVDDFHGE